MFDRKDRFGQMVGDILRETSPVIRCCILLGCGVGIGGSIWVIARLISTGVIITGPGSWERKNARGICCLILLGGAIGGLFAGLVLGVVIELILEHFFGIRFDEPGRKKRQKHKP